MDKKNRDRAIKVAAEIESLRGRLAALEAEFDGLLALQPTAMVRPAGLEEQRATLSDEIIARAASHPSAFSVEDVLGWMGFDATKRSVVLTTLSRMHMAERVERVARGLYRLKKIPLPAGDLKLELVEEAAAG